MRLAVCAFGVVAYLVGVSSLVYGVGFLANAVVPKGIDAGDVIATSQAAVIDVVLLLLMPIQHSIMARPRFKLWWTQIIPGSAERSTFVLIAGLLSWLLYWQWRPLPATVWSVGSPAARIAITSVYLVGWGLVFLSSFLIDHFDLFGLRQVYFCVVGKAYVQPRFVERLVYRWIRHPLMAGFIVAFWAAPTMSVGRLLFAAVTTTYIFAGIALEERDLMAEHGAEYSAYRQRTGGLLPRLRSGTPGH